MNPTQQRLMQSALGRPFIIAPRRQVRWLIQNGYMAPALVTGPDIGTKDIPVNLTIKGESWCRRQGD